MNRQIKFRTWDKQRKGWVREDDSSLHCQSNWFICPLTGKVVDVVALPDNEYCIDYDLEYYMEGIKIIKESRFVIQQYTGLKDKNGKEVYEGDIVAEKHDGGEGEANIGKIFFAAGSFIIDGDGPLYDHTFSLTPDILEDYLVVGNMLENPELIK